jgi:hypothetical protein
MPRGLNNTLEWTGFKEKRVHGLTVWVRNTNCSFFLHQTEKNNKEENIFRISNHLKITSLIQLIISDTN